MNDKIDNLLARYFNGEATQNELQKLDDWMEESQENQQYFMEMTSLFEKMYPESKSDFHAQTAAIDFKKHIYKETLASQPKKRIKFQAKYWSVAALVLLLVISGLFVFNRNQQQETILAENDTKEIRYADNIDITLKQNSTIEYKKNKPNEVILKGEAIFSVDSQDDVDFTVYAGKTIIKDIGTIFTVTAFEEEDLIKVHVKEGVVLFYTNENSGITISEDQTGIYSKQYEIFELILPEIKPQISQAISFDTQSLSVVVADLEEKFNIKISIEDKSLENLLLTAEFNHDESLDLILSIIAETLSVKIIQDGSNYKIVK
jgi:ferric-dicitrate binding protein FerR (iron transport regulator)